MYEVVNVHYVDFPAFFKGDLDYVDPEEIVMVFDTSPSFAGVVEKVRSELNWMDQRDVVDLKGRYNVGFDHYIRWKMMPLKCENHWQAYKEIVLASQDKSLELFAVKRVGARVHIDLNRQPSTSDASSPVQHNEPRVNPESEVYDTRMSQPPLTQPLSPTLNNQYGEGDGDEGVGDETRADGDEAVDDEGDGDEAANDEFEGHEGEGYGMERCLHNHDIGDVEANCYEETMDHDIPYARSYALDSEDEGPDEEIDEDGLTAKEAKAFMNAFGRDHRTSLFSDLSLSDKAIVDGGTSKILGPRSFFQ